MRWRGETFRSLLVLGGLLVAVSALYRPFKRLIELGPEPGLNQLLLPVLSLFLVVLALAMAGVLVRNLVRLIVDRKRGILGARLRTKLVFFFLALVLLPALVLFSGSAQIIKQSVEAVLRTPLEDLTERSSQIVEQWKSYLREQALDRARAVAAEIEDRGISAAPQTGLAALVERWQLRPESQQLRVAVGGVVLAEAPLREPDAASPRAAELATLLDALAKRVEADGTAATQIDYLGARLVAHAAAPVRLADGRRGVVSVAVLLPARLAGNLEGIDEAARIYRQFRVQRRELVRFYLTLIGLVFLVTLFVATWIGLYLARRITGPIQELAAATREIATGNLGVRVRADTGDELGMLVEAFNDMAAELQESREVITRSTADLRRSNRALDERRRYIETLLANLSTAVISLDSDGRVTTANPAVRDVLGVELPVGDDARGVLSSRGLGPLAQLIDRGISNKGEDARQDLELALESGTRSVAAQVSPLRGGSGEDLGTLVMVEDLTELLRAQRAAAWREVARRIAHEIKNPLTPIQLSAQRLRKKFDEGASDLSSVLPEATASIEREVGALKKLVDEFTMFARLPEVSVREVRFEAIVDAVQALFKGATGVHWAIEAQTDGRAARVDPDQMRRALINLVDNAIEAIQGQGTISICTRLLADDRALRVEVADDGPGVASEDMAKMFNPYFSTKKRGTGLGLAIVHKIVTDHGGTVRVEPNRPQGVRIVIDLPQ